MNDKDSKNKPVDAGNHAINALEWIGMELPANPSRLSLTVYDEYGRPIAEEDDKLRQRSQTLWQLDDDSSANDNFYDDSLAFGIEGGLF